ncbi:MAG: Na+/H+ antiporter NhaC [Bacteroidales bacterium]|nr:Na+/H+ antiporter NhaC [Bacteroidales bacterium]
MASSDDKKVREVKEPTLFESFIPIIFLLGLILLNVLFIGEDTLSGTAQLSLMFAALVAGALAVRNGVTMSTLFTQIEKTISSTLIAILILLAIGMLAGTWMLSGVIPTMIYYGLYILKPEYYLPATVIICAITSMATGSSWSTIATVGVALLGIGETLGFGKPVIAGAIISGSYFGDKVSPMSDTTNLAASVAEVDLFKHIGYMFQTTIPTLILTLLIFTGISLFGETHALISVSDMQAAIKDIYHINWLLFLIPIITIYLIIKKVPAVVTLLFSGILAGVFAVIFQMDVITAIAGGNSFFDVFDVVTKSMYGPISVPADNPAIAKLFATSGMSGMLNTVWLVLMAMAYGGIMDAGGFLKKITDTLLKNISSDGGLVTTTTLSTILFNIVAAEQYVTLILSGKMYANAFKERKLAPELLSRTLEDSGTVTSVLIPWNSCGATQSTVLGVATLTYLPFCFFCYLSPLVNMFFAWFHIKIRKTE